MKLIRNLLLTVLLVIAIFVGLIVYSFSRTLPLQDRQRLSGGAIQVKDGIVSVAIIPSGDGQVILVDCGNDPTGKATIAALKQLGLGIDSVKTILITHAHPDHIGGCHNFPDAEIFAMTPEQPILEGREANRSVIGRIMGRKNSGLHVSRYLKDGETLQRGNVLVTAYLVPGHTDGSAAYLAAGTLYLGDSADSAKNGTLLPAKRFASNDTQQNQASLRKLAEELKPHANEIEFLEFAHSGPLQGFTALQKFANSSGSSN